MENAMQLDSHELKRPIVGIGVLVIKDDKVLLGNRIGNLGDGTWAPPGGHLEFGETMQECAARELLEETGLIAQSVSYAGWVSDVFDLGNNDGKHYITFFMIVDMFEGIQELKEPAKCSRWEWFDMNMLPENLFKPFQTFIDECINDSDLYYNDTAAMTRMCSKECSSDCDLEACE